MKDKPDLEKSTRTSIIVALNSGRIIGKFLQSHYSLLVADHIERLLITLEAQYWYALSFNKDLSLRSKLGKLGFKLGLDNVSLFPDMLNQEVQNISIIIGTVFEYYAENIEYSNADKIIGNFENRWMARLVLSLLHYPCNSIVSLNIFIWYRRYCSVAFVRYLELEARLDASGHLDIDDPQFTRAQHVAYSPIMLDIVKGILSMSRSQFSSNTRWIIPMLSRLITVSNKSIRVVVSSIYKHHIDEVVMGAYDKT